MSSITGAWLLIASSAFGLATSLINYFIRGSGIDHTAGGLLVVISTAALVLISLLLVWAKPAARWLRATLGAALIVDVLGTSVASYFLHAWAVLAFMIVALIGWIMLAFLPSNPARYRRGASSERAVMGVVMACAVPLALTQVSGNPSSEPVPTDDRTSSWSTFNGDLRAQKYAIEGQITRDNVSGLEVAWEVHTGDVSTGAGDIPATVWSATPLFVNETVYIGTPFYRIFAIAPDTGAVKWIYDPDAVLEALTQPELKTRGVAYWEAEDPQPGASCEKRVYIGTMAGKLHAVDADAGTLCKDFGDDGVLNVNQWNTVHDKWPLSILQPPTVYKDTLFIGWAGKDWASKLAPPGVTFAVDARTGELKWTFNPLPPEAVPHTGTADVWTSMSVDPQAGIVYLPVSSPSPNFYGGNRTQPLPLTTAVVALDADTGELIWSRQLVHHDLWDFDADTAPVLVDIERDGQVVPALVQSTKQGSLFVLNRLTGEPIYPITEQPVPHSDVPGEQTSPTQPHVGYPLPVDDWEWPGIFTLSNLVGFGQCSRDFEKLRYEGPFTPPSLGAGTLTYPGTVGGVEWGGGAVDPTTQTYVVNSSNVAMVYQLLEREEYEEKSQGDASGYFAMSGTPYGFHLRNFFNWAGMPCWNPPYGYIMAYDLKSGRRLWREPFGAVQKWGFYMPESWGSVTIGPPMITRTGVIFIGASMDSKVRALDLETGEVLWKAQVDAPAVALPATYTYRGRQYVVFTAGGNSLLKPEVSDQLIAFALPDEP